MAGLSCFLRRASCSIRRERRAVSSLLCNYQREIFVGHGGQFPPSVRYLAGSVDKTNSAEAVSVKSASAGIANPLEKGDEGLSLNDFVIKDGPVNGTLTLISKRQHEIISIDVTTYENVMDYYDAERGLRYPDLIDSFYGDQLELDEQKLENPDQLVDANPCLHLRVNILYGYMFRKSMKFNVLAMADSSDKILIRDMIASVHPPKDEEMSRELQEKMSRELQLEDFEDFLKIRGIHPKALKSFYDN